MKWNKPTILCSISLQQVFPRNQNQNQGYSHEGMKKAELNFIAFLCKNRHFSHIYYSPPIFEYEKKIIQSTPTLFSLFMFSCQIVRAESGRFWILKFLSSNYSKFAVEWLLNSLLSQFWLLWSSKISQIRTFGVFWKKMRFSGNKTYLCSKSRMGAIIL